MSRLINPLFICLFLISPLFSEDLLHLKERHPHFQEKTLSRHENRTPHLILYSENGIPMKELEFSSEGDLIRETDLDEKSNWHGPTIFYHLSRTINVLAYYKNGLLDGPYKMFYDNGQLKSVRYLKDGHLEGPYFFYYENGDLSEKGTYLNGHKDGYQESYYPNNKLKAKAYFEKGLLENTYSEWDENGHLILKALYFKGLLNGERTQIALTSYHPNLRVKESLDYRVGMPIKTHQRFFEDGKKSFQVSYYHGKKEGREETFSNLGHLNFFNEYSKGNPIGKHEWNYQNGKLSKLAYYDEKGGLLSPIREFDPQGTKRLEYSLKDGLYEGTYLEWDANGVLKQKLKFKNDHFDEEQSLFSKTSQTLVKAHFQEGVKNGSYETWYLNGEKRSSYHFLDGKKEGRQLEWYSDGKIAFEASYKQDHLISPLQEWYKNGQIKSYIPISPKEDELHYYSDGKVAYKKDSHGAFTSYFPDGAVHETGGLDGEYLVYHETPACHPIAKKMHFKNGTFDQKQLRYFENGQIQAILNYKNGLLDGPKKLFDEHGNLLEEAFYTNGLLEGRFFLQRPNGTTIISHYKNNKLEGEHQVYYPAYEKQPCLKALEASFKEGILDGEFSQYNESGIKILEAFYVNGEKDGMFTLFSPEGKVIFAAEFLKDKQHGITREYASNGSLFKEAYFIEGVKNGKETTYFDNGKLKALGIFKNGLADGIFKEWNHSGSLIYEAEFKSGLKDGKLAKYDDLGNVTFEMHFTNDLPNTKH